MTLTEPPCIALNGICAVVRERRGGFWIFHQSVFASHADSLGAIGGVEFSSVGDTREEFLLDAFDEDDHVCRANTRGVRWFIDAKEWQR
jgi:hypothetical protein